MSPTQLLYVLLLLHYASTDYWQDRNALLEKEALKMLGSSIILTPKEELVNHMLMTYKAQEYDAGFQDPSKFNPARHFFQARKDIENSPLFKMIKKMPKGAVLHAHDFYTISQEYFLNLTRRHNVYACWVNDELFLKFLADVNQDSFCTWTPISELRQKNSSFDEAIQAQFFLNVEKPREVYPHLGAVWNKMNSILKRTTMFLTYKEVFQEQFYSSLLELYNDNVKYYEFRSTLSEVYELNGTLFSPVEVASLYQETIERFRSNHPDFIGARLIYTRSRRDTLSDDKHVQILNKLQESHPNLLAAFDICAQEDLGEPLQYFVNFINSIPKDIKRIFHAGETNWYGSTDLNLVDAVLLNATRIGHAFAVTKHPSVLKMIKKRKIPIEVCPISHQVLMLIDDLRNHPAVSLLARGYPIVISNDNALLWGSTGLSYDFYLAFLGMTSRGTNLKFLKQLALNSLEYSTMPLLEKQRAFRTFQKDWEAFLDWVIEGRGAANHLFDEL